MTTPTVRLGPFPASQLSRQNILRELCLVASIAWSRSRQQNLRLAGQKKASSQLLLKTPLNSAMLNSILGHALEVAGGTF